MTMGSLALCLVGPFEQVVTRTGIQITLALRNPIQVSSEQQREATAQLSGSQGLEVVPPRGLVFKA